MSKATLVHPSWTQIEKGAASLALQVAQRPGFVPRVIIGLARGGLVPAVIISHLLKIKMFPVSYSSKKGNGEYKEYENKLPEFPMTWDILIVDDICDTGYTMAEVSKFYASNGHNVRMAALYHKDGAIVRPDFVWQSINENSDWIEFPWEF